VNPRWTIFFCGVCFFGLAACQDQEVTSPTQGNTSPQSTRPKTPSKNIAKPTLSVEGPTPFLALFNGQEIGRAKRVQIPAPSQKGALAVFPWMGPPQYFTVGDTLDPPPHFILSATAPNDPRWQSATHFTNVDYWILHAEAAHQGQHPKETATLLNLSLKTFPKNASLWRIRARHYNDTKRYEAALNAAQRYLELAPEGPHQQEMERLKKQLGSQMDDSAPIPSK
jgi:hypothetical protein